MEPFPLPGQIEVAHRIVYYNWPTITLPQKLTAKEV